MRAEGTPNSTASVGLVAIDEELLDHVRKALSAEAVLASPVGFDDGIEHLSRQRPDVALVGIDTDQDAAVAFARSAKQENLDLTLIAVARSKDSDAILTAMRVGFEEFVVLPDEADQLREAVRTAATAGNEATGNAMVVSVIGAKGGVGTTLVAAHLAAELAGIHRVLCADMNFGKGDLAAMMDVNASESIAELLPRAANADERMLAGHTVVHGSKVHLLLQPDNVDAIAEVAADDVFNVINAAAQGYQYVLLDVGTRITDDTDVTVRVADHVLLITTPDVVSVRNAHRTLKSLVTHGVDRSHIHLVVNRMPVKPYLTAEQIESTLGVKVVGIIPDDPRRVDQAVNEGKLLRELFPRSEIVVEIGRLVGLLSDDADPAESATTTAKKKGGLFSSLFSS